MQKSLQIPINKLESVSGILLTCSSRKIHIVNWLKCSLKKIKSQKKLFLADSNSEAISRCFTKYFWVMPTLQQSNFNKILKFLLKKNIQIIFPSSDFELLFWAKYRDILRKKKIFVMISDLKTVKICLDKYLFYNFLVQNKIKTIPTSLKIDTIISKKYVVKSRFGYGSKNCFLNLNYKEAKTFSKSIKNSVFQKFIDGDEVSIDCYVSLQGKYKILMRHRKSINSGESEHIVFFKDKRIYLTIEKLINKLPFYGHIMFQGIISKGVFYVMECNPRIGGASATCYYKDLDSFFEFISENLNIKKNNFKKLKFIKKNNFILHKTITPID